MSPSKLCTTALTAALLAALSAAQTQSPKGVAPRPPAGLGPTTTSLPLVNGSDSCATPDLIAGTGIFAYDTSTATTGTEGQSNSACMSWGTLTVEKDVWFEWTAPAAGLFQIDTCGQTADDTKVAVYDVLGCPGSGTQAITCNDDNCSSFQSGVTVCVASAGQQFAIQLGHYPGSAVGPGTFTITSVGACIPNDSCATPQVLTAAGQYAFDNTYASGGPQGQNNANCNVQTTNIISDLWYSWTAPSNGAATFRTCLLTGVNTKMALYTGAGCPSAAALACNDDGCASVQSQINFNAVSGQTYMLQLGAKWNTAGGLGALELVFTGCPAPFNYCTAKISSSGCTPAIASSGSPSLASPAGFTVTSTSLEDNKFAITFFGTTGQNSAPFQGGVLCAKAPIYRLALKNSGGAGACQGAVSYTLADYVAHPSGGSLVVAGAVIDSQTWFRDPGSPSTTGLSNGLEFQACP